MSPCGPTRGADFIIIGAGVMGASIAFHLDGSNKFLVGDSYGKRDN